MCPSMNIWGRGKERWGEHRKDFKTQPQVGQRWVFLQISQLVISCCYCVLAPPDCVCVWYTLSVLIVLLCKEDLIVKVVSLRWLRKYSDLETESDTLWLFGLRASETGNMEKKKKNNNKLNFVSVRQISTESWWPHRCNMKLLSINVH